MAEQAQDAEKLRLGGMALQNGLLVHGPTHWSAAIRASDGEIKIASGKKPRLRGPVEKVPGARGVIRLAESMIVIPLVMRALPQARLPFQNATVIAAAAATAVAGGQIRKRGNSMGAEIGAAMLSLAPSLIALRGGDTAAYHGVEHKAIGAYEQGDGDARDATKEHDRCGSHLIAPLLVANLGGVALMRKLVKEPNAATGGIVSLASIGIAVEVFLWSERNSDTPAARALRKPGHELQRLLGTREPTEKQLEVGRAALDEILLVEKASAV